MIKHVWSVLCRESIIQQDNTLSIRDVLENLNIELKPQAGKKVAEAYPLNLPVDFEICCYLEKLGFGEASGELKFTLIKPNGETANTFTQPLTIPANNDAFRVRNKVQGLVVEMPGRYVFAVELRDGNEKAFTSVAELPLKIRVSPAED